MRTFPGRLVLLVTPFLLAGCPHTAVEPTPKPAAGPAAAPAAVGKEPKAPKPDDPRLERFARVLRASDRRVADDDVRALVSDSDPTVRAKAVLALGQIGDLGTIDDVAAARADPSAAVRAAAAYALGLFGDPKGAAAAAALASDPDAPVRAAAVEALGRIHDPQSAGVVRAALGDPDAGVRAAAGLAAWKFAAAEPFLEPLFSNLSAPNAKVRAAAAYALARLTSAAVAPPSSGAPVGTLTEAQRNAARAALAVRVGDVEPEVRMQVARGLASPQGPGELAVVGTLSGDPDARVRVNAVRALGYPGIPIKPYLDRAVADRDVAVIRTALESLGKVGGALASEKLNEVVMKLSGSWLREAALNSLIQVDPAKAQTVVEGLLVNDDPYMRASTGAILVGRKDSWAIRAVIALLGDKEPRVVVAAIPLVAEMDGSLAKLLAPFFASADPVVRAACADAVGIRFVTPQAAVESRAELYGHLDAIWASSAHDTLADAKLSVLDAATKGGKDDATRAALERGLADPDVLVRRRAALRLHDVFGEDRSASVGPSADRPLEDYVAIARWALEPHAAVVTMQRTGTLPGRFAIALDADAAPMTAWNFASLAGKKFFDGLRIHRMVPNFVVQDGDPRGDGYGGPGYAIRDEFNPLPYTAGTMGMASDGKDTAGSQWFITLSAQPHLDGRYTSFAHVTQGFREIVTQILPADEVVSIRIQDGDGTEPISGE